MKKLLILSFLLCLAGSLNVFALEDETEKKYNEEVRMLIPKWQETPEEYGLEKQAAPETEKEQIQIDKSAEIIMPVQIIEEPAPLIDETKAAAPVKTPIEKVKKEEVKAPIWEEYVPKKFIHPRTDFRLASAIIEMDAGVGLTMLIITAPIGIPMICHSASKMKQMSYARKKAKFTAGLKEAEKIQDPEEKRLYYKRLVQDCRLKESNRQKYLKKQAKKAAKQVKIAAAAKKQ